MTKTVTLRIDEEVYKIIKFAAQGDKRTISNFIEYATMNYLSSNSYVSDNEMDEIVNDDNLKKGLKKGLQDIKKGKYIVVS
ncbi:MAG TPA: CopG family transcriptional regulator [Ignavibacteria bacterium]|nr:CopG family transcriptional regulator [Ignavibacteria bacterium]